MRSYHKDQFPRCLPLSKLKHLGLEAVNTHPLGSLTLATLSSLAIAAIAVHQRMGGFNGGQRCLDNGKQCHLQSSASTGSSTAAAHTNPYDAEI